MRQRQCDVTELHHARPGGGGVFRYKFLCWGLPLVLPVLDIIYTRSSQVHLPTIEKPCHSQHMADWPDGLRFSGAAGQEMRVDTMREIQPVIVRCHES